MEDLSPPNREYPQIDGTRRYSNLKSSFRSESTAESMENVIESSPRIAFIQNNSSSSNSPSSSKSSSSKPLLKKGGGRKSWLGNMFRFKKQKAKSPPTQRLSTFAEEDFGSSDSEDEESDSSDVSDGLTPEEIEKERREDELRMWKGVLSALGKYDNKIIEEKELKHMLTDIWQLDDSNLDELKERAKKKCQELETTRLPTPPPPPPSREIQPRTRKSSSYNLRGFDSESDEDHYSTTDDSDADDDDDDEDESGFQTQMTQQEIEEETEMEEKLKWDGIRSALRKYDAKIIEDNELQYLLTNMWGLGDVPLSEVRARAKASEQKDEFKKKTSSGLKLLQKGLGHGNVSRARSGSRKTFKMNLGEINQKYKALTRKSSVMFSQKKREFKGRGLTITTGGIESHAGITTSGHRVTMHEYDFCRLRTLCSSVNRLTRS